MQGCGPGGVTFSVSVARLWLNMSLHVGQLWPYEVVDVRLPLFNISETLSIFLGRRGEIPRLITK